MSYQAHTKEEVIERLNALEDGDDDDRREAVGLLTDALIIAGMDEVVTAYIETRHRLKFK